MKNIRHLLFWLILGLVWVEANASEPLSMPLTVKSDVEVSDKFIRLEDLFEGLTGDYEARRTHVVAKAPVPGKTATLDHVWLSRVAKKFQLDWTPKDKFVEVSIKRASRPIQTAVISDEILKVLSQENPSIDFMVKFDNPNLTLYVAQDDVDRLTIENLVWDRRSERFVAKGFVGHNQSNDVKITGRALSVTEVPALRKIVHEKSIVQESDIHWIKVPNKKLPRDSVLTEEGIVGMSPKRAIRVNAPVPMKDLQLPIAVKKNSLVTLRLRTKQMTLTMKGRALESKPIGQPVRVVNVNSHKTVTGIVTGPDRVDMGSER